MLNAIVGLLVNTQDGGRAVDHERVLFKFIENDFEKLQRLFELHLKYFGRVADFDLSKFNDSDEIQYLVDDY